MSPVRLLPLLATILLTVMLGSGCRKKTDSQSNANFESAAASFTAADAAPAQPAAPGAGPVPVPAAAQEMQSAVQAYKVGQFEEAVTRLQKLRHTKGISGAQLMALNDAMAAMMGDIQKLADKGDQRAVQAIKRYEKMQTGER